MPSGQQYSRLIPEAKQLDKNFLHAPYSSGRIQSSSAIPDLEDFSLDIVRESAKLFYESFSAGWEKAGAELVAPALLPGLQLHSKIWKI